MSHIAWDFPQRLGWRDTDAVLMIWAYYDESGEYDAAGNLINMTVAGCVSTSEKWQSFDTKWREFLASEGLSEFHMTDFEAWKSPFNFLLPDGGRDRAKHNRVLNGVLDLMIEYVEGFYAYGAVSMYYPDRQQTHEQLMNDCIEGAVKDIALRVWGDYRKPVNLVFGKQPHLAKGKIEKYVNLWNLGLHEGSIGTVTHCSTSNVAALQAADILAYEVARAQRANRPERYPFQRLIDAAKTNGQAFSLTWGPMRPLRARPLGVGESLE
jgi:hypothetical protein